MAGLAILLGIALALLIALLTARLAWEMVHPPRHTTAWALARKLPADPGEVNLAFDEWWLDRPDGARLAVWEVSANPKSKISATTDLPSARQNPKSQSSLTAIFIHGWGHSRIDALQRIGPFVPLVDRVVLYDLRGHGDSTDTSRLGDGEDEDLLALLDRLGQGPFVLIGHSMGAVIALSAASQRQDDSTVIGVIAYGAYCEFHRSLQGRLHVHGLPARPLTDLALLVHRMRGVTPLSLNPQQLAGFRCPLLVIHGLEDRVSPVSHARRIADCLPCATVVEIDDAAHADTHRVDEALHDEAVNAFLTRLSADRAIQRDMQGSDVGST